MSQTAARLAILIGGIGSFGLMIHRGGRGVSLILWIVMTTWVLAPFAALELGRRVAARWAIVRRGALNVLIAIVAAGSLGVYIVDAVTPLNPKAAFVYVVVPLVSWILIAATVLISWLSFKEKQES